MRFPLILLPLIGCNFISLVGFATFASNPDYLNQFPWAAPILEISYPLFSRLQILLALGAMLWTLRKYCQTRWIQSFLAIVLASLSSELLGTSYGVPFGAYSYSSLLGGKILGHVPWLIPLSWFYMSVASYDLVRTLFPKETFSWKRALGAACVLVVWDLVLDPAMSHLTPFWLWENPGGFFGMPLSNILGWLVTGFTLMCLLERFQAYTWLKTLPSHEMKQFYLANLMLPLGMCLLAQLWIPVILVISILLPLLVLPRLRSSSFLASPNEAAR